MLIRSTAAIPHKTSGGRPLIDEQGHVAHTIRRETPWFTRVCNIVRDVTGSPRFSGLLLLAVLVWLAAGPLVDFSKAWELSATAGAPIIGLILLAIIQHTQNRDDKAIQLKLNEIIRASEQASDGLIGIEDSPEVELSRLLMDYRSHAGVDGLVATSAHMDAAHQSGVPRWSGIVDRWNLLTRRRRYAQGDLGLERSFVFRSPGGGLYVRAQNLALFIHLAEAVDDATWLDHLRRGDYSRWFREVIQDEALAYKAQQLEGPDGPSAEDSRHHITAAITQRYPIPI